MSDADNSNRYLLYEPHRLYSTGLNNWLSNFISVAAEAVTLNRIPVMNPIALAYQHNWGLNVTKDFSAIMSTCVRVTMKERNILRPLKIDCLDQKDFNLDAFSENEIKCIEGGGRIDEQDNQNYPLIIRKTGMMGIWRLFVNNFLQERKDRAIVHINFQPAKRIADIAKNVIAELGGIPDPDAAFNHCRNLDASALDMRSPPGAYACAHVRGGDIARYIPEFKAGITPRMVFKNLKRGLPERDIPLYVMTDIRDDKFFSKIKRHLPVKFADDFAQLRDFYPDGDNRGDNLSLFAVERMILSNAAVRIHSHTRGQEQFSLSN